MRRVPAGAGAGGSLLFGSDWANVTPGNTEAAAGDGGKWSVSNFSDDRLTIIAATGLGFHASMANVLRVRHRGTEAAPTQAHGITIASEAHWPILANGEHQYGRLYFRMGITSDTDPGSDDSIAHPVQTANLNMFGLFHFLGANFLFYLNSGSLTAGSGTSHHWDLTLARATTYRLEWHYERTDATHYNVDFRAYNEAVSVTVPAFTNTDMTCSVHGTHTLASITQPLEVTSSALIDSLATFQIGHEGDTWGPFPDNNGNMTYYGGFAVSASGWIGQYVPGEAD